MGSGLNRFPFFWFADGMMQSIISFSKSKIVAFLVSDTFKIIPFSTLARGRILKTDILFAKGDYNVRFSR
jgi:hypothetical protein